MSARLMTIRVEMVVPDAGDPGVYLEKIQALALELREEFGEDECGDEDAASADEEEAIENEVSVEISKGSPIRWWHNGAWRLMAGRSRSALR